MSENKMESDNEPTGSALMPNSKLGRMRASAARYFRNQWQDTISDWDHTRQLMREMRISKPSFEGVFFGVLVVALPFAYAMLASSAGIVIESLIFFVTAFGLAGLVLWIRSRLLAGLRARAIAEESGRDVKYPEIDGFEGFAIIVIAGAIVGQPYAWLGHQIFPNRDSETDIIQKFLLIRSATDVLSIIAGIGTIFGLVIAVGWLKRLVAGRSGNNKV